jgi:branched-chain amino acid aminotransferase
VSSAPQQRWVFHQEKFVRAKDVGLGPGTQGLHYGTGVFEGIRSYTSAEGGEALLFKAREHYERLHAPCCLLRLNLPYSPDELVDITREPIVRNELVGDAYIRPLVYKLALEPGTRFGVRLSGVSTSVTILALPMGDYSKNASWGNACPYDQGGRYPNPM